MYGSEIENDEARTLVAGLDGLVSFNWSPDGNAIAYRTVTDEYNDIIVIDALNAQVIAGTRSSEVIAFFWSPDSSKIAYMTPATLRGAISNRAILQDNALAWWLLDVNNDRVRRYNSFTPTDEMLYLLTYFDQFAQSHSLWSPDSTHIVFVEQLTLQNHVISLLDMTQPDAVPFAVANGLIGIWSYR